VGTAPFAIQKMVSNSERRKSLYFIILGLLYSEYANLRIKRKVMTDPSFINDFLIQ